MRKAVFIFISQFILIPILSACDSEDDITNGIIIRNDTTIVNDTTYQNDTIINIDTTIINDTVYKNDTIINRDTVIYRDTIINSDTIVIKDTITKPIVEMNYYMVQSSQNANVQAADCYNGILFQFENFNQNVYIYDLNNKNYIGKVSLVRNSHNHCNNVSFSRKFYQKEDLFPLLYVSGGNTLDYNRIHVYRITTDSTSYIFQIIQEITLPSSLFWTNAVIDNDNNFLYIYANTWHKEITKFNIPPIKESKVTLTENDILEQFSVEGFVHQQGACIRNGVMIITDGVPARGDTNFIRSID